MSENADDDLLMQRVQSGDTDAFAVLVDRYKDPLVNYLANLCGDRDRAEDVAQDSFVKLFRQAGSYDGRGKLAPYLYRIATNHLRSAWRREKRWKVLSLGLWSPETSGRDPSDDLLSDEATRQVREALASLPLPYRAPLVLRDIEGWTYQQIADFLDCPEGTVKSKINRGRQQLRQSLASYWNARTAPNGI